MGRSRWNGPLALLLTVLLVFRLAIVALGDPMAAFVFTGTIAVALLSLVHHPGGPSHHAPR